MRFYWRSRSVPELADLPPKARKKAFNICFRRAMKDLWIPNLLLSPILMFCICVPPAAFLAPRVAAWLGMSDPAIWHWIVLIPIAMASASVWLLIVWPFVIATIRPYLREFLVSG